MAFMAPVAMAAMAVGSVVSAVGAVQQGRAANQSAQYNAAVMEQDARRTQDEAATRAGEAARRTRQALAATRAGASENGFDLSGSIGDLLGQTERQGNLDALTAIYEGRVRSDSLRSQAAITRVEGRNAQRAGNMRALGSLFSAAGSTYATGYQLGYFRS